jgi:hypothetical protein
METNLINSFEFKFDDKNNCLKECCYIVTPEIILHICQIDHNLAKIYCTNKMNHEIELPENMYIYKYNFQDNKKVYRLHGIQNNKQYIVCGEESYTIEFNDKVILNIESQKQWNIKSALFEKNNLINKKQCLTSDQQLQNLIKELGLSPLEFPVIYRLPPFHEVECVIHQRKDTSEYVIITSESSWRDDTDDYFSWKVIGLNENKLLEYEKYKV